MTRASFREIKRRKRRHEDLIAILGGICKKCGSNNKLEFDHINPDEKEFNITEKLSMPWAFILKEINKCQLLCENCHEEKTKRDRRLKVNHGTIHMYYGLKCRCEVCKIFISNYRKNLPSRQPKSSGRYFYRNGISLAAQPPV